MSLMWLWLAPSARAYTQAQELLCERRVPHRVLLQRGDSAWLVLLCDADEAQTLEQRGVRPLLRHPQAV